MLNEKIKNLRIVHDITQADLAKYLGVTPKAVSFYELGQREPSNETLVLLAKKFNVTTDYLLGLSENNENNRVLSSSEIDMIDKYRLLDEDDKKEITFIIDMKIEKLRKKVTGKEETA